MTTKQHTPAHTPGPWTARQHPGNEYSITIYDCYCVPMAHVSTGVGVHDWVDGKNIYAGGVAEANARLIAAAPETAAERDRLKAINAELLVEVKELLRNARFQDGQGIILTQDAEALERTITATEERP